jgi:hypothetical protein
MALLRSSELTVTEVCFRVGFSSLGTFSTRFTEIVGMSPSAYRARSPSWAGEIAPCVSMRISKPVRNREGLPGGVPYVAGHEDDDPSDPDIAARVVMGRVDSARASGTAGARVIGVAAGVRARGS